MENEININAILNTPWLLALLPLAITLIISFFKKFNSPLKENAEYYKSCGIPPVILRLSLSRNKLAVMKPYNRMNYIFVFGFSIIVFAGAFMLTYITSKAYHESPKGWALLQLTSTGEHFLISSKKATSPDKKSWELTPQICTAKTYEAIAKDIKSSTALVARLCSAITLKSEDDEIKNWITKVHNASLKLLVTFIPALCLMYWFALALMLDGALKITIDKYNKEQNERARFYLT